MISKKAAEDLYCVLRKYVRLEAVPELLQDLAKLPGNRSYKDTIAELQKIHLRYVPERV